jgi:hypothetical protein
MAGAILLPATARSLAAALAIVMLAGEAALAEA